MPFDKCNCRDKYRRPKAADELIIRSNFAIDDTHNGRKSISAYKQNKNNLDSPIRKSYQPNSSSKSLKRNKY
jgi:hypothetical protein